MSGTATPQHEFEVLAVRNMRTIAKQGLPDGWLTEERSIDLMLATAIELAAGFAERAFLAVVAGADHMPNHITAGQAECITLDAIADMQQDAARIVAELRATPDQCQRLMMGQAALFDLRLAELQTLAIRDGSAA